MKTKGRANALDAYIGKRLKAIRKAQNMSQEVLADKIGITFQQVQKYERGLNRISASRLCMIARALGQQLDAFVPAEFSAGIDLMHRRQAQNIANDLAMVQLQLKDIASKTEEAFA